MSKRMGLALIALLLVAALAAWAFAQLGGQDKDYPELGRFAIASGNGPTMLLVDTSNGKTWMLSVAHPLRKNPVAGWLPLERFDDQAKADEWLRQNESAAPGRPNP